MRWTTRKVSRYQRAALPHTFGFGLPVGKFEILQQTKMEQLICFNQISAAAFLLSHTLKSRNFRLLLTCIPETNATVFAPEKLQPHSAEKSQSLSYSRRETLVGYVCTTPRGNIVSF